MISHGVQKRKSKYKEGVMSDLIILIESLKWPVSIVIIIFTILYYSDKSAKRKK